MVGKASIRLTDCLLILGVASESINNRILVRGACISGRVTGLYLLSHQPPAQRFLPDTARAVEDPTQVAAGSRKRQTYIAVRQVQLQQTLTPSHALAPHNSARALWASSPEGAAQLRFDSLVCILTVQTYRQRDLHRSWQ